MSHDDLECPYLPAIGYPDFWRVAHEHFLPFFDVAPRLYDAQNSLSEATYRLAQGDRFKRAMVELGNLATQATGELIVLVGNGHGIGALKITRTMLEYAINVMYLREHPVERESYLAWYFVEQHRFLEYMKANDVPLPSADVVARNEEGFRQVEHLFTNRRGRLRGSWSRHDLAKRAEKVGLAKVYALAYDHTSKPVHGTFGGLALQLKLSEDGKGAVFEDPPSLENCEMALRFGHLSAVLMLKAQSALFGEDSKPPVREIEADHNRVWDRPFATL